MATATTTRRRTSSRRSTRSNAGNSSSNGSILRSVSQPVGKAVKTVRRSAGQLPTWLIVSIGVVALGGLVYATGLGSTIGSSLGLSGGSEDDDSVNEMETF